MNLLFTISAFGIVLGVLIVVHELGHYLVARWCGVKVLRFSVGFGKLLASRRFGSDQTEWAISAFPLGGYVKMLDEREGPVASHELDRAFNRQSVGKRSAIVVAGPVANLLLAVVVYWALFMHGVPGVRPVLGDIPRATPAAISGFNAGDVLKKIGGTEVPTWQEVRWVILKHVIKKQAVEIEAEIDGGEKIIRKLDLSILTAEDLDQDFLKKLGLTYFEPKLRPVFGGILPGGSAAKAGLGDGDAVVSINDQPVTEWNELVRWVRQNPGKLLKFEIVRKDGVHFSSVIPESVIENGKAVGKIGAAPAPDPELTRKLLTEVRYGPLRALGAALDKTWDTSIFSLEMMGKMVVGQVSWRNISGPITIADYAGQSAQMGWMPYLTFMALISISLGVLNLLPIPLLDGGHLMYYMAEILKGSPVSEMAMEWGQKVGIAILLVMMIFAFYNDINRLITG
jgi:regulator of sigma E protease